MSLLLAKFDDDLATRQAVTPLCITPMVEANTPVSQASHGRQRSRLLDVGGDFRSKG
jgi:hypothetical protein